MRTKNNIIMKTKGGMLYSGSGLHRTAIHRNLRETMKTEKAESSSVPNQAVFGKILGAKKDSDTMRPRSAALEAGACRLYELARDPITMM